MGYFRSKLKTLLEAEFITPDMAYHAPALDTITFIFINGHFYAARGGTHTDLLRDNFDDIQNDAKVVYESKTGSLDGMPMAISVSDIEYNFGMTGRSILIEGGSEIDANYFDDNENKYLVTIWADNAEIFKSDIKQCLAQLIPNFKHKDLPIYLSSAITGVMPLQDAVEKEHEELSDEEKERIQLLHKLHLMNSNEKRAAMKKLGLATGGKKHEYQKGSEDIGVVRPGQKWWANTSESYFFDRLAILEEINNDLTPDNFHRNFNSDYNKLVGDQTFIYYENYLYSASCDITHYQLLIKEGFLNLFAKVLGYKVDEDDEDFSEFITAGRNYLHKSGAIFGRTGVDLANNRYLIILWQRMPSEDVVADIVKQLREYNDIEYPISIKASNTKFIALDNILSSDEDEEIQAKSDQQYKLHTMGADQKRLAMQDLGLSPYSNKNKYQLNSELAGITTPGHKWWASTSESYFKKRLSVLEST